MQNIKLFLYKNCYKVLLFYYQYTHVSNRIFNICNYCNKEIDLEKEDKVYCDRCKADYHRDCWIKNRKCVLCDCKTCSEVFSLNKKHNDTDSNTASEFIIEEKPQSKSGKFLEFLKTVGAFLYLM